jgi:hypothetical protein
MFRGAGIVWLAVALAGCGRSLQQDALTVGYYRTHALEREGMLRTCADDPGRLQGTANCVNAREAARAEGVGSLKDLPSMGLPGSSGAVHRTDTGNP